MISATTHTIQAQEPSSALDLARCASCGRPLGGRRLCAGCGIETEWRDGILKWIGPLQGRNRIAAALYDGPDWRRFEPWERLFLWFQGPGERRARRKVLRYLPDRGSLRVLEVGIGAGANVPLLAPDWEVHGVDFAGSRLEACASRFPELRSRLIQAEAESLPYGDSHFDAVFTVGAINYFRDPHAALSEMRRVAKPGGVLIAADERPDLYRFAPGHALGLDLLDHWCLRAVGVDEEFLSMVLHDPAPVPEAARQAWPNHQRHPIWNRLGYCLVDVREN